MGTGAGLPGLIQPECLPFSSAFCSPTWGELGHLTVPRSEFPSLYDVPDMAPVVFKQLVNEGVREEGQGQSEQRMRQRWALWPELARSMPREQNQASHPQWGEKR